MTVTIIAILVGVTAGLTSGLFGVGGGIVLVPLLTLLLKMDFKHAVTASLVIIIPTALSGIIGHLRASPLSKSNWMIAGIVIVGAIVGAQVGVWLCHHLPIPVLKKMFACILFFMGIKMFIS